MISLTRDTTSPEATAALAKGFADVLALTDVVAVHGSLGAGKTTFTRALARALGTGDGLASSPTFVMINQYPFRNPRLGEGQLIHVDAYRLSGAEEVETLGWDALFDPRTRLAGGRSIALIEWADRIREVLPREVATLTITPIGETSRRFDFQLPEQWQGRPGFEDFRAREPSVCPSTGEWVSPTSPTYPFATPHAKMADLNRWFSGQYTITRGVEHDDLEGQV